MEQTLVMKELCRQRFQPAVDKVKELLESDNGCIVVAIDGMSASGKSTLGCYLKELFECNLFHMDDFFLQDNQRTEERLAEVGGNVDYERFREEVLQPLSEKDMVVYRPFRCNIRAIEGETKIAFKRLNIIEGSYSQHPYFENVYDNKQMYVYRIFTEIPEELQMERIRNRNGEVMLKRFIAEWIPKENAYFEKFQIKQNSDMVL